MLARLAKAFIAVTYKIRYISKCRLHASTDILLRGCDFEGENALGEHTYLSHTKMGYASYTGFGCEFSNTVIGRFCSIGSNVRVVSATHPLDMVSTHPAFYSKTFRLSYRKGVDFAEHLVTEKNRECEIGNDVWIGDNVLIKGGVKIGNGAVIAMGSVVLHDVPAYGIVAGVPARLIRYRFDDETVLKLQKCAWWDKPIDWIKTHADCFISTDRFLDVMAEKDKS